MQQLEVPEPGPLAPRVSVSPFETPCDVGGGTTGWRTGGWSSEGHNTNQGGAGGAAGSFALCTSISELQRTCPSHLQPRSSVDLELPLTSELLHATQCVLGQGAWGDVRHGTYQGQEVAIKYINWSGEPEELESLQKELVVMSRLKHPNIVTMFGGNVRPDPQIFLVQELMACSVSDMIHGKGDHLGRKLTLLEALKIAHDVTEGLTYLHTQNVIHRDIKPDNTLLTWDGVAKIGDFGLARFKINTVLQTRTLDMGTAAYMAPEILDRSLGGVTVAVDIFSFGIMLWELLMGERPYENTKRPQAIFWQVLQDKLRPPLPQPSDSFPPEVMLLVLRCWAQHAKDRPTVQEVGVELAAWLQPGGLPRDYSPALLARVEELKRLYNLKEQQQQHAQQQGPPQQQAQQQQQEQLQQQQEDSPQAQQGTEEPALQQQQQAPPQQQNPPPQHLTQPQQQQQQEQEDSPQPQQGTETEPALQQQQQQPQGTEEQQQDQQPPQQQERGAAAQPLPP